MAPIRNRVGRRAADPRRTVVLATVIALAAAVALGSVLLDTVTKTRASVAYVANSIRVPLAELQAAYQADDRGEAYLAQAAADTGAARNSNLSQSIYAAEAATKAWTGYRAAALGLPGESKLAARYSSDYLAGEKVTSALLVGILRSDAPGVLPSSQVLAAQTDRQDLLALIGLYQQRSAAELARLGGQLRTAHLRLLLGGMAALVVLVMAGVAGYRSARQVVADRRKLKAAADLDEFETRLIRALEYADDETTALRVGGDAIHRAAPDAAVAVLSFDADTGAAGAVAGGSACSVSQSSACPAIKSGSALQFPDSTALDACPSLAGASPCSVTCVPVSIAGAPGAVIQTTGSVAEAPVLDAHSSVISRRLGDRVTLLRAFAQVRREASIDPLTGLSNRRTLKAAMHQLNLSRGTYSVAFADLDHFKALNDQYGHEAGDRALRTFSATVLETLRPDDLSCRWGGEEFVMVLPGCEKAAAVEVMERLRGRLAELSATAEHPISVSIGVTEAAQGEAFDEVVARADAALRVAKDSGRDRVVGWSSHDLAVQDLAGQAPTDAAGKGAGLTQVG